MRFLSILLATLCLYAQAQNSPGKNPQPTEEKGMPPRATPADYQAQANAGKVVIAAEFMGHSVPRPEGPLSTDDYVVVETGLFGPPGSPLKLSTEDFSLRVNGKKALLPSQPYGFVVASLKDPAWTPPGKPADKPKTSFGGGGGSDSNLPPPPVHVPIELQRAMAQYVRQSSLPEGDRTLPEAGLLFFQYRGPAKNIHSLELIYGGPAGKAALKLQP